MNERQPASNWSNVVQKYTTLLPHAESPSSHVVVPTGLPSLDKVLSGGFRTGELVALGGDAGQGTSSLALAFALNARGLETLVLTSEMSPDHVVERALASESRTSLLALRQWPMDDDVEVRVAAAATRLSALSLSVVNIDAQGIDSVRSAIAECAGVHLVIVDGLEALCTNAEARDDQLAMAVLELKRLALEFRVAIVLVSHLPIADRTPTDKRPRLSDFGVRGAIATHADTVLGLFREDMYLDRYQADASVHGAAELLLLKRRDGALGYIDLFFHAQWLRFEDVLDPES